MSKSSNSLPKNPITYNKYEALVSSPDPIAKKIVSNVTTIYNNAIIFNDTTDVAIMDNSIINIQNTFNDLINLATPCASISNTDKCSTPVCNFVSFIENLYLDIFLFINAIPAFSDSNKEDYLYLPFFMTTYFANMVTNNPNNRDLYASKIQYKLCSGQTYVPSGLTPSSSGFDKIIQRSKMQQSSAVVRQSTTNSINFLTYILLPTVVVIILILIYIQYSRKVQDDEDELNEVILMKKKK
jgi:hypothetical protein